MLTMTPIDAFQCPHWTFSMPPLTLLNAPIDPSQCRHWPFSIPPLTLPWLMPPLTLFNAHYPFQCPFSMPPLTLSQCPHWPFQCPHWPFSIPHQMFSTSPLKNVQHPHWNFSTPPLKCFNTCIDIFQHAQTQLDTPQIRLDTPQIRLNTTLNDKSNRIRTKFDWIRPRPPPKALKRRHRVFTSVQAVSWKTHATISTNSTKPQPNQNRKIATSPRKDKGQMYKSTWYIL